MRVLLLVVVHWEVVVYQVGEEMLCWVEEVKCPGMLKVVELKHSLLMEEDQTDARVVGLVEDLGKGQ